MGFFSGLVRGGKGDSVWCVYSIVHSIYSFSLALAEKNKTKRKWMGAKQNKTKQGKKSIKQQLNEWIKLIKASWNISFHWIFPQQQQQQKVIDVFGIEIIETMKKKKKKFVDVLMMMINVKKRYDNFVCLFYHILCVWRNSRI